MGKIFNEHGAEKEYKIFGKNKRTAKALVSLLKTQLYIISPKYSLRNVFEIFLKITVDNLLHT